MGIGEDEDESEEAEAGALLAADAAIDVYRIAEQMTEFIKAASRR